MHRILVTGGAGFIGSHLVEALESEGYQVAVIDDLSSGSKKNLPKNVELFEGSIENKPFLHEVFSSFRPSVVNHLAAQIDVNASNTNPINDVRINVLGLVNVLESSREFGVKHFVFASSGGAVYGDKVTLPTKETAPTAPKSIYGISKLAGEYYVNYFSRQGHFKTTIFRYANVYGPRQLHSSEGGVISIFLDKFLSKQSPVIYGDGKQTRDFVFVKDVVKINGLVVKNEISGIYNIGTGQQTSILSLYQKMSELVGVTISPTFVAKRVAEVRHSSLEPIKVIKALPEAFSFTTLDSGLEETIAWFQNKYEK